MNINFLNLNSEYMDFLFLLSAKSKTMKTRIISLKIIFMLLAILMFYSCTKDGYLPPQNSFVKKIKVDGYIVDQYTYTQENLILEVNSTLFYRKFHYDNNNKLIKEEVAVSPYSFSSSAPSASTHEFIDPAKTGISMYSIYEYENNGNLARQLNYVPENGKFVFRSMRTFEYSDNNLISKALLHDSDSTVTQEYTYRYDNNGNVIEENYLTWLFIPDGTGPKLLSTITFEYDSYLNPYSIFKQSADPGISTNLNNIIKTKTHNWDPSQKLDEFTESVTSYEYDFSTGYPIKVINGEEFVYD